MKAVAENSAMRDWADIRLFLAILERGSLSAAAEFLDLTQPTVGRRLAAMEERFATPLFVRSGRRMQLTDAGAGIVESAQRMEREMLAIERSLEVQSSALCGEVTISAAEGTGTQWLTPVLFDFQQQYPEIVLQVQIENRTVDLVRREADIALRFGRPTQGDLIARRLASVGFGLYASEVYLQERHSPTSLEEVGQHPLVGLANMGSEGGQAAPYPAAEIPAPRYVYVSNSPAAQLAAVQAGFGIGVLSHRWAAMVGGLIRVLPDYSVNEVDLWLVTHEELRYSARIRAVSDFIAERVIRDARLFELGY